MRIAWGSVGSICGRVSAEAKQGRDLFASLKTLGFDEIAIRKGQKHLTLVVDHHTGRLRLAAFLDRRHPARRSILDESSDTTVRPFSPSGSVIQERKLSHTSLAERGRRRPRGSGRSRGR